MQLPSRLFLCLVAGAGSQAASGATPPFELRLELTTPLTNVLVWQALPMTLTLENIGTGDVPFASDLWAGQYAEAQLTLVAEAIEGPGGADEFALEPDPQARGCYSIGTRLLQRGERQTTSFAVGGRGARVSDGAVSLRTLTVPLFPRAARYALRVRYRYRGTDAFSNTVHVQASEPSGRAAGALERLRAFGDAYWLYEPQLMPRLLSEAHRARLVELAEDFGINPYSELAWYALANADIVAAYNDFLPMEERRAAARRALERLVAFHSADDERMADAGARVCCLREFLAR